jgi:hypothetical protein
MTRLPTRNPQLKKHLPKEQFSKTPIYLRNGAPSGSDPVTFGFGAKPILSKEL